MGLSPFIVQNMESILAEWETFARTLAPAADGMNSLALRDHAQQILEAIAKDLTTSQTRVEQSEKSKGRALVIEGTPETAAQTHAVLRARSGFDINQLVSEYRALRASVLRLWMDASALGQIDLDDVVRFNEAIDQAIAESVGHFHMQVERARNLLLGMLGHDMRSPLNTIVTTASYLGALNAGEQVSLAAERLIRSGASMQALLDDLVDFNRTRLGLGINIKPDEVDLAAILADEIEQLRGAHPTRQIELSIAGATRGHCDRIRFQQVVRNLVSNAIRYGFPNTPVRVAFRGEESTYRLEITNSGTAIDPAMCGQLFDPLKRGIGRTAEQEGPGGLGLGLFIVREIAKAHGGDVDVRCERGETTFAVHMPRQRTGVTVEKAVPR